MLIKVWIIEKLSISLSYGSMVTLIISRSLVRAQQRPQKKFQKDLEISKMFCTFASSKLKEVL